MNHHNFFQSMRRTNRIQNPQVTITVAMASTDLSATQYQLLLRHWCLHLLAGTSGQEPDASGLQRIQALHDCNAGDLAVARGRLAMQGWPREAIATQSSNMKHAFWHALLTALEGERDARRSPSLGFVPRLALAPEPSNQRVPRNET